MENSVTFASDGLSLQGLLQLNAEKGVVITHPHPLYGGDMHNPVVESVRTAFQHNGYSTLRFNFRGVGGSQGSYNGGDGEIRDVANAMAFLSTMGVGRISLAGYSFGARINAGIAQVEETVDVMIMVSPPVAFMDFSPIKRLPSLRLVVAGVRDDIAAAERLRRMVPDWNAGASFEIIDGADHFFDGHLDTLTAVVDVHVRNW